MTLDSGVLDTAVLDTDPVVTTGPSARSTVTPREAWRRARLPLSLGLAFTVVAVLHALTTGAVSVSRLDPEAAGPDGALALATLLRQHGVDVRRVDAPTGGADTTVFVPVPLLVRALRPSALTDARVATELVVATPEDSDLEAMDVDAGVAGQVEERVVDPACTQPDATAAGDVLLGGYTFGAAEDATPCYAIGGEASFVEIARTARRVTLLGTDAFMTNEHLDDHGNAALALRLLTRHPTVEWVYPRTGDTGPVEDQQRTLFGLLPHRVFVFVAELFVALLLLALWRGRRLGPVVVEPLPVVVRAAEAVEGRARLYEAAHSREQAGNALRAAARDRLVRVLGLAPDAGPDTMVAAVTSRTGRDGTAAASLLYGPPPADDAALVRLAADLDQLDSEVRAL